MQLQKTSRTVNNDKQMFCQKNLNIGFQQHNL